MKINKKYILLALLITLIALQFVPLSQKELPNYKAGDFLDSSSTDQKVKIAFKEMCYDCHSYETKWPSYTKFAPVSLWINGHVKAARANVNFSIWDTYSDNKKIQKIQESIDKINANHMPPKSYRFMHKNETWTPDMKKQLLAFLEGL